MNRDFLPDELEGGQGEEELLAQSPSAVVPLGGEEWVYRFQTEAALAFWTEEELVPIRYLDWLALLLECLFVLRPWEWSALMSLRLPVGPVLGRSKSQVVARQVSTRRAAVLRPQRKLAFHLQFRQWEWSPLSVALLEPSS